jgi:protein TonB
MRLLSLLFLVAVAAVAQVTASPVVIHQTQPRYTLEAQRKKVEGTVVLYVEIAPDGRAHAFHVTRSLGSGLDEKAIEAVRQWRFLPGLKDGRAVTTAATIEVTFRLHQTGPLPGAVRV